MAFKIFDPNNDLHIRIFRETGRIVLSKGFIKTLACSRIDLFISNSTKRKCFAISTGDMLKITQNAIICKSFVRWTNVKKKGRRIKLTFSKKEQKYIGYL
jgi:hypothetical protein